MSTAVQEHKAASPQRIGAAVLTVSDTRTEATDTSGALLIERLTAAGHTVADRAIVPDEPARIRPLLETWRDRVDIAAVLITGGTGIAHRDQTFETVSDLLTKPLPGFGELFRMLSYEQIGPSAMLSRATAGAMGPSTLVFLMPGSRAAVELAIDRLILPELTHAIGLLNR